MTGKQTLGDKFEDWIAEHRLLAYFLAFLICGACVLVLFFRLGVMNASLHESTEKAGQFGDSFGFVNSLFSGLALVGVVLALLIQTMEFRLAAKERRDNLDIQSQIAKQQYFSTMASSIDSLTEFEKGLKAEKIRISAEPQSATFEEIAEFLFDFEQFSTLRATIRSMRSDPEAIKFLGLDASKALGRVEQNISTLGELCDLQEQFIRGANIAITERSLIFLGEKTPEELINEVFSGDWTDEIFWPTSRRRLAETYRKFVADLNQWKAEGTLKDPKRRREIAEWENALHTLTIEAVVDSLDYSFGKSPLVDGSKTEDEGDIQG